MSELFDLFSKIDSCDINYFKNLPEEERKKLYLFLVQRWMTGATDSKQILYINSFVNSKIFNMYDHPDLVYKLLCVSSTGKKRYVWKGRKKKEKSSITLDIIREYHRCSLRDAKDLANMVTLDDLLEMAETLGVEKETIASLKKEYK